MLWLRSTQRLRAPTLQEMCFHRSHRVGSDLNISDAQRWQPDVLLRAYLFYLVRYSSDQLNFADYPRRAARARRFAVHAASSRASFPAATLGPRD